MFPERKELSEHARSKHLKEIYEKLVRDAALRKYLLTQDKDVQAWEEVMTDWAKSDHPEEFEGEGHYHDRAVEIVHGILNKPTNVARSELLVDNEAKTVLDAKMELVRTWLWEHGRPPQGEELERAEASSRVADVDDFWLQVDPEGEPQTPEVAIYPAKLYVGSDDTAAKTCVRATFGYDNRYNLEIEFYGDDPKHPNTTSAYYFSARRPVEEMAENEAAILGEVLDGVIAYYAIEPSSGAPHPPQQDQPPFQQS